MQPNRIRWTILLILPLLLIVSACGRAGRSETTPTAVSSPVMQPAGNATQTDTPSSRRINPPGEGRFDAEALEMITSDNIARLAPLTDIGEGDLMTDLAVSPDGQLMAIAARGGVILVDATSGKRKDFIPVPGAVENLDFSPDGTMIAEIYRVVTGKTVKNVYQGEVSVEEPTLTIHRVADQKVIFSKPLTGTGCADSVAWGVRFSADGRTIVLRGISGIYTNDKGIPSSFDICPFSAADGSLIQAIRVDSDINNRTAALFMPDGQHVVAVVHDLQGETTQVNTYDIASGQVTQGYKSQGGNINSIALSPDGQWLALAELGGAQLIDMGSGSLGMWINSSGSPFQFLAFSADGKTLVLGTLDGQVSLWQIPGGTQVWHNSPITLMNLEFGDQQPTISDLAFLPDGKEIFSLTTSPVLETSNLVQNLQTTDGHEISRIYGRNSMVRPQLSPDGSQLVFGGYQDGQVQLWSIGNDRMIRDFLGHTKMVMAAIFSPDGGQVATASQDGTVGLWKTNDGSLLFNLNGHQGAVWSIAYSLDGTKLASVGQDATLRIWNPANGNLLKTFPTQTGDWWSNTIAFSADGKSILLAYGCEAMLDCPAKGAGDLRRIDLETGQAQTLLSSPIFSVTLSADRMMIGITGRQGQQTGDLLSRQFKNFPSLEESQGLGGVGISPDGSLLISGNYHGLNVWKTATGENILTIPGFNLTGNMSVSPNQQLLQIDGIDALAHFWGIRMEQ